MTNRPGLSSTSARDAFATLVDLLRARAAQQPRARAFTFLDGWGLAPAGDDPARDEVAPTEHTLTYGELDLAARQIGRRLQAEGARGQRVLLVYPSGLDYIAAFFGCLYAGAVAVPVYPPDPARLRRELGRFQTIVADAAATFALTTRAVLQVAEAMRPLAPALAGLRWLATDLNEEPAAAAWQPPDIDARTLAFLQYTSGSTSAPKGVMLSHGNLLANEAMIRAGFEHDADARILGWLPLYHDMGLIGNVLQPVYLGASCVLMSPTAFLQRPVRWLQAIARYRATSSGAPNFGYELCLRKTTPAQRAALDLRAWDVAFCGAEPVRADTLARFAEAFAPAGFRATAFYPCYGLAEASLIVTGGRKADAPIVRDDGTPRVGCGTALGDGRVAIVDPETRAPRPAGASGEIWVAGPHVAAGYWQRPALTEATFGARTADGDGPYLRTGDLGVLDDAGQLFVSGRLKELIILRGRNLHPQDLEHTLERSHAALRPGAGVATSIDGPDGEAVLIVHELRPGAPAPGDEIVAAMLSALASEHALRPAAILLVAANAIPKTSSGKLQRTAVRDAYVAGSLDAVHRWDGNARAERSDAWIARIAEIMRVPVAALDRQRPLSSHGLDSLAALEIQSLLADDFGIALPASLIASELTLDAVAALIADRAPAPAPRVADVAAGDGPITHGQRGLWLLQTRFPTSTAYNVTSAFRALAPIDVAALRRSLAQLVARHAALRTVYPLVGGEPIARVLPAHDVELAVEAFASEAELARALDAEAHRPFALTTEPAVRFRLLATDATTVFVLNAHHIACDLWSLAVVADELGRLYGEATGGPAAALATDPGTMSGYAARQRARLDGDVGQRLLDHARKRLAGAPVLALPLDRPRPTKADERGAKHGFALSAAVVASARQLAAARGASLASVLLASFVDVLAARAGQDEVVLAAPAANRSRRADHGLVGFLVNPVVVRASTAGQPTFAALVDRVHRSALEALDEQELPFPWLVERLGIPGDASGVPLVRVAFGYQRGHRDQPSALSQLGAGAAQIALDLGPLRLASIPLAHDTAQFELALVVTETDDGATGMVVYRTALFDAATIAGIAEQWIAALTAGCASPTSPLRASGMLAATLAMWNQLFGIADLAPDSNFFDLGGHSLLAIQLTTLILEAYGVEVTVPELFHAPTPAGTAALIEAKRAAAAPADRTAAAPTRAVASDLDDEVRALWIQLFGAEDVAADANFFDLGGHSLLAIQLTTLILDKYGVELTVAELFVDPTIAGHARLIAGKGGAPAPTAIPRVSRAGVTTDPASED